MSDMNTPEQITEDKITRLYECLSRSDTFDIALDDVFALLTDHYRATKDVYWRSVDELPESNIEVMVHRKGKGFWWGVWHGDIWLVRHGDSWTDKPDITHWMPLPTPPSEGESTITADITEIVLDPEAFIEALNKEA